MNSGSPVGSTPTRLLRDRGSGRPAIQHGLQLQGGRIVGIVLKSATQASASFCDVARFQLQAGYADDGAGIFVAATQRSVT